MKILVLMKMVPDIVEELEVAGDGTSLDQEYLRFIVNERDDYALEQALLLKDRLEANVTVVAPEAPEVDDVLYTALAKGADRVVKVSGAADGAGSRSLAATLAATLPSIPDVAPSGHGAQRLPGHRRSRRVHGAAPRLGARPAIPGPGQSHRGRTRRRGGRRVQGIRRRRDGTLRDRPSCLHRRPGL